MALILLFGPALLDLLAGLAQELRVWDLVDLERPDASPGFDLTTLVLTYLGLLTVLWLLRARRRVVIEDFVDYTNDDERAVKGLATLLIAELGRLRELYMNVNDQLSIPTSVGVTRRGGTGGATELGQFLTVSADDTSDALTSAVAVETKLSIGPILLPVGTVVALVGRIARGPRVLGSVQTMAAGGGPVLTAQIVGRGKLTTWRVDARGAANGSTDRAVLDPMIAELACRMFTDLTLRGSVRWRAIDAFTEYLDLYWESLRTPKNRARFLRRAEGKLMEAIAEDDKFDLAYYNLGVIYSQLAEAERAAARLSALGKRQSDPQVAYDARTSAAVAAFRRAVEVNPGRAEAVYALAVHRYTHSERYPDRPDNDPQLVVDLCDRVIKLDRRNSQAHDMKGMALLKMGSEPAAMRNHRRAVGLSWLKLCSEEYKEKARPATQETILPSVQENAAAALHNLARAHQERAIRREGLWRFRFCQALSRWCSDLEFHQAIALAPPATHGVMEFSRGRLREEWGRWRLAIRSYREATRLDRDNPVYWAHLSRAFSSAGESSNASHAARQAHASYAARQALASLAPVFQRSFERFPMDETIALRDAAIDALDHSAIDETTRTEIRGIRRLRDALTTLPLDAEREELEAAYDAARALRRHTRSPWQRDQIDFVRGRLALKLGRWTDAHAICGEMLESADHRPTEQVVVLRARRAKALRKDDKPYGALTEAATGLLRDPLNAVARREVGKAHFSLHKYADAMDVWRDTHWLTPNDPFLHSKMGLCSWRMAQAIQDPRARDEALGEAREYFDHACLLFGLENVANGAWSVLWRGRVAAEQGDYDAAIPDLRAAVATEPTHLAGKVFLAEAYGRSGRPWLSDPLFDEVHSEISEDDLHDTDYVDNGWGDTLTRAEALARAATALARSMTREATPSKRDSLADQAIAAAHRIPDRAAQACCLAAALDVKGELLREVDIGAAVEAVERASQLSDDRGIQLHLLQLYEQHAREQGTAEPRDGTIQKAEQVLSRLRGSTNGGLSSHESDGSEILKRIANGAAAGGFA